MTSKQLYRYRRLAGRCVQCDTITGGARLCQPCYAKERVAYERNALKRGVRVGAGSGARPKYAWHTITDWSRSLRSIARELGCTHQAVAFHIKHRGNKT